MTSRSDHPVVEKWAQTPLDIVDPQERFEVSRWNYFYKDTEGGLVVGHWECAHGTEFLDGTGSFDEMMIVIEGKLEVECEGQEYVAEPGDTVIILRGRPTRVSAKQPAKVIFICFPLPEIEQYEAQIRQSMHTKGIV